MYTFVNVYILTYVYVYMCAQAHAHACVCVMNDIFRLIISLKNKQSFITKICFETSNLSCFYV